MERKVSLVLKVRRVQSERLVRLDLLDYRDRKASKGHRERMATSLRQARPSRARATS